MNQVEDPYGRRRIILKVTASTADAHNVDSIDWSCISKAQKMHMLERLTNTLNYEPERKRNVDESEEAPVISGGV